MTIHSFVRPGRNAVGISVDTIGFTLVASAYLAFFISDVLLSLDDDLSQPIKVFSFGLLVMAILLRPRFHRAIFLVIPVLSFLLISLGRTFSMAAGMEELFRFFFPIIITVAIYAYREKLSVLLSVLFFVVLTNDLFQIYFYFAYVTGLPLFLPVRIDSGIFLRAQGWLGFFSEFSYINFCAFVLLRVFASSKKELSWSWIFLFFALAAFSFKLMAVIALYPLTQRRVSRRTWLLTAGVAAIGCWAIFSGYLDGLLSVAWSKIGFYITNGNSARAESYRVMLESLLNGNFLGEGLGTFGGPASVKFDSPLYARYNFNWYGLGGILKTTDTFYPHLFVELGVLGALMWLCLIVFYGQGGGKTRVWYFFLMTLLFDNFFSMSFVSPAYIFSALLVMYAISRGRRSDNFRAE